jgi:hypothetical protein
MSYVNQQLKLHLLVNTQIVKLLACINAKLAALNYLDLTQNSTLAVDGLLSMHQLQMMPLS